MIIIRLRSLVWLVTGALLTVVVIALFSAWRADAAPVDGESTYVPVTPCRLFDYRPAPFTVGPKSTPIGPAATHTQQVTGSNGDCTIPSTATAIAMNVTIVDGTGVSYLTLFPSDADRPLAANLNWIAGQPPTGNKVDVKLSAGGQIDIYNNVGTVYVVADVAGYYTSSTITDLETRLAALETKLSSMSVVTADGQPTVRFTDVNVQIVNGTGTTDGATNSRGNLIIGYNEQRTTAVERTGSHVVVIGPEHGYTSGGGLIAGYKNTVSGRSASVTGGSNNTASGFFSAVTAGSRNLASGADSSVTGGSDNTATGGNSSVAGGRSNTANANASSVSGGAANVASGTNSSVTGGSANVASAESSSVSGGSFNVASGTNSSVTGGNINTASGIDSVVVGGFTNSAGRLDVQLGGDDSVCNYGSTNAYICGDAGSGPSWISED